MIDVLVDYSIAFEEALYLSNICDHVTLIHRREEFRCSPLMVSAYYDIKHIHEQIYSCHMIILFYISVGKSTKATKHNYFNEQNCQRVVWQRNCSCGFQEGYK